MTSQGYVKYDQLQGIERLVALYRRRKRVDARTLERIRAEFAGVQHRVNQVLVGKVYDLRVVLNLQKMLTAWSAAMVRAGLFPVAFVPVITGTKNITITWQDPVHIAKIAQASPIQRPETMH